jgi:hypothetical protein
MYHQQEIEIPSDVPSPNVAFPERFWTLLAENAVFIEVFAEVWMALNVYGRVMAESGGFEPPIELLVL